MGSITNASNAGTGTSSGSVPLVTLTETLLNKHNDEMEKFMLKKHREGRGRTGEKCKKVTEKILEYTGPGHGVKRGGSHSWEGEANKPKQQNTSFMELQHDFVGYHNFTTTNNKIFPNFPNMLNATLTNPYTNNFTYERNLNLWPPFSVSINSAISNATPLVTQRGYVPQHPPTHNPLTAFYYIPAANTTPAPQTQTTSIPSDMPSSSNQSMPLQYMTGVVYPHPSFFYTPAATTTMMYQPVSMPNVGNRITLSSDAINSYGDFRMVSLQIFINVISNFFFSKNTSRLI